VTFDVCALDGCRTGGGDVIVNIERADGSVTLQSTDGVISLDDAVVADLYLSHVCGGDVFDLIDGTLAGWQAAHHLMVATNAFEAAPHPPFDVGPQPDTDAVLHVDLVVQHVKRASTVGTLRYVDRYTSGRLLSRTGGTDPAADLIVMNTFAGMIATLASDDVVDPTGGVQVVARSDSLALAYASLQLEPAVRHHISRRIEVAKLLCVFAQHTQSKPFKQAMRASTTLPGMFVDSVD
jgi:hypothetical protein